MAGLQRPAFSRPAIVGLTLLGLALALIGVARLKFAATEPLWFDESFSLAIASRPDGAGFWREVWLDSNGPAYYLLLRGWTAVFGASDLALRVPSLLAIWAAAAAPLFTPRLGREARITWAVLVFAWWGVGYFLDARCYAILLAVCAWQCVAFARLMDRPGLGRALAWAAIAALAILLHYYALFLGLAQGLIYLGRHRLAAVRTWPAALAFVPAFAWIAHHAPRLADYSRLAKVWHPPLDGPRISALVAFVFGPEDLLILPALVAILAAGLWVGRPRPELDVEPRKPFADPLVLTAASGILAFALMVGFGLAGSGLSPRYLIPVAPPLLLGVVLIAQAGRQPRLASLALVLACLGLQVRPALDALKAPQPQPRYEFETGSAFLMAHGVTDLVFVWDHELAPIMTADTLVHVGGVFFDRAHRPVRVRPLVVDAATDPNLAIPAAAQGSHPGLIWLFNRVGHTAAHRFAPDIRGWACTDTGAGTAGALACYRRDEIPRESEVAPSPAIP